MLLLKDNNTTQHFVSFQIHNSSIKFNKVLISNKMTFPAKYFDTKAFSFMFSLSYFNVKSIP